MPDFMSVKRLAAKLSDPKSDAHLSTKGDGSGGRFGGGISNLGPAAAHDIDDGPTMATLIVRGSQIVIAACLPIVAIVLCSFQSHWLGAPSGLSGFVVFIAILALLASCLFVVAPIVYERSNYKRMKGLNIALSEARVGLVLNGAWTVFSLILAMALTISAISAQGCRNPTKDPHANSPKNGTKEDYQKALGSFCTTKRAAVVFAWMLFVAWGVGLIMFLRQWRVARKNGPRIPPFTHPVDDSAFEPIHPGGEEDDDLYAPQSGGGGGGGGFPGGGRDSYDAYGAGARYGDGGDGRYGGNYDQHVQQQQHAQPPTSYQTPDRVLADIERRYGGGADTTAASNPFEDRYDSARGPSYDPHGGAGRPSYDYGAYGSQEPPRNSFGGGGYR